MLPCAMFGLCGQEEPLRIAQRKHALLYVQPIGLVVSALHGLALSVEWLNLKPLPRPTGPVVGDILGRFDVRFVHILD